MQMVIAFSALVLAASAAGFTYLSWTQNRNAQLVQIGVGVLEIDPQKEKQVQGAREWALDLIDANAGGIKFSQAARSQLLQRALPSNPVFLNYGGTLGNAGGTNLGGGVSGNINGTPGVNPATNGTPPH
jgi:hypothetical protein